MMSFLDVWSKAVVIHAFNSGEILVKGQMGTGGMCDSWGFLFNEVAPTQENFDLSDLVKFYDEAILFLFKWLKLMLCA